MLLDIFKWCFGTVSGADSDVFVPYFFHGFGVSESFEWEYIYIILYYIDIYIILIYIYTLVPVYNIVFLLSIHIIYIYVCISLSLSLSLTMISEHMRRSDISQAEPWCFFAILDQAAVPPRALEQRGRCDVSFSEVWLDLKSDGWSPFFPGFSN